MSRKELRHTDTFRAKSEDGQVYTVHQYQTFIEAGDEWLPGLKSLKLSDGRAVNFIEEGTYDIVWTPMIRIYRMSA
jgi:hypothetical protein